MDDVRSAESADGDAGLGRDRDWEGWGVGGRRAGSVFEREGARLIASRSGRHLIGGVVSAIGDSAGKSGGQSVLSFFGVDKDRRGAVEGDGDDDLGVGAGASDGENGIGVRVEVVVVLNWTVRGGEGVDERGGFDDFFNESQNCKGKSEAVEMLLTLEDFLLLLSSSGRLWWYCLTISGACTLSTGSQVLSLNG